MVRKLFKTRWPTETATVYNTRWAQSVNQCSEL